MSTRAEEAWLRDGAEEEFSDSDDEDNEEFVAPAPLVLFSEKMPLPKQESRSSFADGKHGISMETTIVHPHANPWSASVPTVQASGRSSPYETSPTSSSPTNVARIELVPIPEHHSNEEGDSDSEEEEGVIVGGNAAPFVVEAMGAGVEASKSAPSEGDSVSKSEIAAAASALAYTLQPPGGGGGGAATEQFSSIMPGGPSASVKPVTPKAEVPPQLPQPQGGDGISPPLDQMEASKR